MVLMLSCLPSVHRGGNVALSLSAQCCLWRSVSLCGPFFSDLVNQVYTSFSLASLRSLLPVTAPPKDGISTLVK